MNSSVNSAGKMSYVWCRRKKVYSYLLLCTKRQLKMCQRPKCKSRLQRKWKNPSRHTVNMLFFFLHMTPKSIGNKKKMDKWDYIAKKLLHSKGNINKVKRQLTE